MNVDEYANLERVEREHWYYAGKRELVARWLDRVGPPRREDTLLDCGAGTGLFAQEMEARCRVLVVDDHEESLRRLRMRFRPEQVLTIVDGGVPLPDGTVDYLTALDVLEHVPDDAAVVRGFYALLKQGGVAIVTTPADMALWSEWDVALHHHRRYSRAQLCALFNAAGWEIVHVNYTNTLVYPLAWIVRRWRAGSRRRVTKRPEDYVPPRWINGLLRRTFVRMAGWRVSLPFGLSLLIVARKRA